MLALSFKADGPACPAWTGNDLENQAFMTGINFRTTRCWEINGHDEGVKLTFVAWVGQP